MSFIKKNCFLLIILMSVFTNCNNDINDNKAKLIVGIPGVELTNEIRDKLYTLKPDGIILMGRNIDTTVQVRKLTSDLKGLLGKDLEISIDCEGGLVNRIKFIDMEFKSDGSGKKNINQKTDIPSAKYFGDLYKKDKQQSIYEIGLAFDTLSRQLVELGITHNFAPVVDLDCESLQKFGRAFGESAEIVIELSKVAIERMIKNGITPVLKHAPGLKTLSADTHEKIAISEASYEELEKDLYIFKELCDYMRCLKKSPRIMVNHGIYKCLGSDKSASTDPKIFEFLKKYLGEDIVIICDDLDMEGVTKESLIILDEIGNENIYKLFCHSLVDSAKTKNLYLSKEGIVESGSN